MLHLKSQSNFNFEQKLKVKHHLNVMSKSKNRRNISDSLTSSFQTPHNKIDYKKHEKIKTYMVDRHRR